MKRTFSWGTLLAVALVLAGCGTSTSPTNPLNRSQLKADGLHMIATISRPAAGTIHFQVGVENGASEDATLNFRDGQFFEIEVYKGSADPVWQWSYHKGFTDSLWALELAPGDSYVRDDDWDITGNDGKPLSPGIYTVRFTITCSPRDEALVYETNLTI